MLVLTAVLLVVFLSFLAYTVDLGNLRAAQQRAQSAADAGALAAASDLPENTVGATTDGSSQATINDPGATAAVTATTGTVNTAQVKVTQTVPNYFGQFFGSRQVPVSASAVAQQSTTVTPVTDGNIQPQGCPGTCEYNYPGLVGSGPWSVVNNNEGYGPGNVDLQQCGNGTGNCTVPAGDTSDEVVDLNGNEPGGIVQTITTVPGQQYVLSFQLSGNDYGGDNGYTFTGNTIISPTTSNPSTLTTAFTHVNPYPNVNYQLVTVSFVPSSNQTTIEFLSTTNRGGAQALAGPEVTDISLSGPTTYLTQ